MVTNRNAWQYHGIRSNPYVILDGYGIGAYTLLVYPFVGVVKIVVQCCYGNALRSVYMVTNLYWTDNRIVQTYSGVIANQHIAHSIVDAGKRFYHRVISK